MDEEKTYAPCVNSVLTHLRLYAALSIFDQRGPLAANTPLGQIDSENLECCLPLFCLRR